MQSVRISISLFASFFISLTSVHAGKRLKSLVDGLFSCHISQQTDSLDLSNAKLKIGNYDFIKFNKFEESTLKKNEHLTSVNLANNMLYKLPQFAFNRLLTLVKNCTDLVF